MERAMQWLASAVVDAAGDFAPAADAEGAPDLGWAWSAILGRPIEVLPVPADHVSMVQPRFVMTSALCIETRLGRVPPCLMRVTRRPLQRPRAAHGSLGPPRAHRDHGPALA